MSIRALLPAVCASTYLNTGAAGPLASAAFEAILDETEWEFKNGRVGSIAKDRFFSALGDLRLRLSRLLKCQANEIAITESTTVALNVALWGLGLRRGDVVLTTNSEHVGALAGLFTLRDRSGISIQTYCSDHFDLEAFFAQVNIATKAVLISHVSWQTGEVYPLKKICAEARRRGLRTIVDGAQAIGAIAVDMESIGGDFYAFPAQKWTLGPEGIGGLFVSRRVVNTTLQTFAGPFSFASQDPSGHLGPLAGASRFEVGTRFRSTVQAWAASLRWLEEAIGWPAIFEKTAAEQEALRLRLRPLANMRVIQPANVAGLTTIELPECFPSNDVVRALEDRAIMVRSVPGGNRIRVSTAFFNNDQDLQRFVEALKEIGVV